MKTCVWSIVCVVVLAGCADPSGITNPVVENPKPIELAITAEHLSEAGSEDRSLTKGDDQELVLVPTSTPSQFWTNANDRSMLVVDTATGRILRMRLSLIPKLDRTRDSMQVWLRLVGLEFDSTANLWLDSQERIFRRGEAFIVFRQIGMGGIVFNHLQRVDPDSNDLPRELRDSVYCKLKLWRTSKRSIVFKLSLQHFAVTERQGQRDLRRIRVSLLGEIPLPR